jgi:catechol 2,3-dioxygenase-like lactoylglutathione lyase family enzyme
VTTIAELLIADAPEAWQAIGLDVDGGGDAHIGMVRLRFDPTAAVDDSAAGGPEATAIRSWTVAGAPDEDVREVDGLVTAHGDPPGRAALPSSHLIRARSLDHLVVMTPNLDRTVQAFERQLGLPLRRTREAVTPDRPARQAFFRMGEVVLEVVGPPEPDPQAGPARFWGFVLTVESLDDAVDFLGERITEPKPAVQDGRFIATLTPAAGLAVPLALMSPVPGR